MFFQKRYKSVILYLKRLFQFIESFFKLTNLFALLKVVKQFDVDFFVNVFVNKDSYDIYLFQILIIDNDENKDNLVTHKFNYDRKDFNII